MIKDTVSCEVCRIGRCHAVNVPYLYWVHDQMMVMPNSPAFACDICGQVQYESAFLIRIECLLQELESSFGNNQVTKQPVRLKASPNWQSSGRGR